MRTVCSLRMLCRPFGCGERCTRRWSATAIVRAGDRDYPYARWRCGGLEGALSPARGCDRGDHAPAARRHPPSRLPPRGGGWSGAGDRPLRRRRDDVEPVGRIMAGAGRGIGRTVAGCVARRREEGRHQSDDSRPRPESCALPSFEGTGGRDPSRDHAGRRSASQTDTSSLAAGGLTAKGNPDR